MKLEYNTKRTVDSSDLDALVEKVYGKPYCFQQQDGCKSRVTDQFLVPIDGPQDYKNENISEEVNGEEMGVSFKAWLSRDPKEPLRDNDESCVRLFWERNFYPSLEMVVQDLFEKGFIERGEYTIVIDW